MKRKKIITENPNIALTDRKNGRLIRYREKLEKEQKEREKKRNALFRKRVNSASEKKAPGTVRTKAYYRFSSEYPSTVSPDGFRENVPIKESMSGRTKVMVILSCVCVFVFTLIALETGILLSRRQPETEVPGPVIAEEQKINACFFSAEDFRRKTVSEIEKEMKTDGFDTILVEFKSEYGYVYFDAGFSVGASADRLIENGAEKVKELKEKGFDCIAYISCFKDSVAALSFSGMEVLTSQGSLFSDSSGAMWLDPYSGTAREYIINIVRSAVDTGFSSVLLDNVCFPAEYQLSAPVYPSFTEGTSKEAAVTEFINNTVEAVGADKVIICCDITGFADISELPNDKYGGTLTETDCIAFCLDMRKDRQYALQLENSVMFRYIEEMPLAFILDAGSLAVKSLGEKKAAYILYIFVDSHEKNAPEYADFAGIKNIISDLSY